MEEERSLLLGLAGRQADMRTRGPIPVGVNEAVLHPVYKLHVPCHCQHLVRCRVLNEIKGREDGIGV